MANKKMTKADYFNQIMENYPLTEEERAFIEHELELLSKKNASKSNKPTKTQQENEVFKDTIFQNMEDNRVYTIAELRKEMPGMGEFSSPKFAALLNAMVKDDRVKKIVDKRTTYWQKIVG